jgi:hypothetical protein
MAMRMPQGGNLGAFGLKVEVNTGDLVAINAKIQKVSTRITPGLWARARAMAEWAKDQLNRTAPRGAGGGWIRGSPPLQSSHHGTVINAYKAVVYSDAEHARYIVNGFSPHMPPEHAWIGQQELSFVMRRAVLNNGTPEAPRDYFTPVADRMVVRNQEETERLRADFQASLSS